MIIQSKPIAITMGEPAGVGAECVIKAWHKRYELDLNSFFIIDDVNHLRSLDSDTSFVKINEPSEAEDVFDEALPVLHMDLPAIPKKGTLNPLNGSAVVKSIETAVNFALNDQVSALVTSPIHKAALYGCGFDFPGHTEFLGSLCGLTEDPVMMLATRALRTVPLTVHIPLKDVSNSITAELIIQKVKIIDHAMRCDFGITNPHIAVAGLNPHAGEGGSIGTEERDMINDVIEGLKASGVNISGTHPADTMFHDQALIPLKTLDFYGGVNVTLGLPIVRTSPDHGTALDIAGSGLANPTSLIQAIKTAGEIASHRSKASFALS